MRRRLPLGLTSAPVRRAGIPTFCRRTQYPIETMFAMGKSNQSRRDLFSRTTESPGNHTRARPRMQSTRAEVSIQRRNRL